MIHIYTGTLNFTHSEYTELILMVISNHEIFFYLST